MKKGTISKVIILIIGLYQVIGGLYGLLGLIYGIVLKKSEFTFVALVICLVFGFSIYAGISLFTGNYTKAAKFTFINQAIQVLKIKLVGYGYQYVAGSYFAIGFTDTPNYFAQYKYAIIKGTCLIWLGSDNEITVMINLIPIILIFVVFRLLHMKTELG